MKKQKPISPQKIEIDYKVEHEIMRRKLWCSVWSGTVSATNCTNTSQPTKYADSALLDFDSRFSPINPSLK